MKLDSLGVVIATRRLVLANDAGRRILVQMGKPEPLPMRSAMISTVHFK